MSVVDAPSVGAAGAVQTALSETGVLEKIAAWRRAQAQARSLDTQLRRATAMIGVVDRINIFTTTDAEEQEASLRAQIDALAVEVDALRRQAKAAVAEVEAEHPPLGLWRRICELVSEVRCELPPRGPEGAGLASIAKRARELAHFIRTTWTLRPTSYDPWERALVAGPASLARHVDLSPTRDAQLHWAALDRREFMALLRDSAVPPDAAAAWAPEFGVVRGRCPPLGLYLDAVGIEGAVEAVQGGTWAFDPGRRRPVSAVSQRAAVGFAAARLRRNAAAALRPMPLPNLSLRDEGRAPGGEADGASLALDAALERHELVHRLETYVDFAAASASAARVALGAEAAVARVVGDSGEREDLDRARRVGKRLRHTLSDRWGRVLGEVQAAIDAQPELRLSNEASCAWRTVADLRGRARSVVTERDAALQATGKVRTSMEALLGVAGDEAALMTRVAAAIREDHGASGTPLDGVAEALRGTGFALSWQRAQELGARLTTLPASRRAAEAQIDVLDTLSPFEDSDEEVELRVLDKEHAELVAERSSMLRLARAWFLEARMEVRQLDLYLRLQAIEAQISAVDVQLEWTHGAPSQVRGVAEARHAMDSWYEDAVQHLLEPRQAEQALLAWIWRRN
jgi:hypothetical protein